MLKNKGNLNENHQRQSHIFHTRDNTLFKISLKQNSTKTYIDPYTVTEVQNNETKCGQRGNVTDTFNLHNINFFKE